MIINKTITNSIGNNDSISKQNITITGISKVLINKQTQPETGIVVVNKQQQKQPEIRIVFNK